MLHLFCSPASAGHSGPPIAGENAGVAHGHSSKRWSPKCTGKSRRFSASRSGHPKARTKCAGFRKYANRHRAYPFAEEATYPTPITVGRDLRPEGVHRVGNENADAQNHQSSYDHG
jgi:hypothetical protein